MNEIDRQYAEYRARRELCGGTPPPLLIFLLVAVLGSIAGSYVKDGLGLNDSEQGDLLQTVYFNGRFLSMTSLAEIRNRLVSVCL